MAWADTQPGRAGGHLDVEVLDTQERLEALASEWRALLERAARAELASTPTWLLSWWRQFSESGGRRLCSVTFRKEGRLVGLAPLSRRTVYWGALPIRRIELLATGEREEEEIDSSYVGMVVEAGCEAEVASALAATLSGDTFGAWDEVFLTQMSGEDPMVAGLEAAFRNRGAATDVAEINRCWYVKSPATWEDYCGSLPKRAKLARTLSDFEKWAGPEECRLRRAETPAELEEGRQILHRLHAERWRSAGQPGVFANPRFAAFHDAVMPKLLAGIDGQLELLWLEVRGTPVAVLYNIVYGNRVYFYQSGRSLAVPKHVLPGIALHAVAIRLAIEAGYAEYDFMAGEARFKRFLAPHQRPLVRLRVVGPSPRARATRQARAKIEQLLEPLRKKRPGPDQPS